ncbi:MAG: hypothetical protein GY705_31445 [Bacteroidetes bacterium]|nr:hypothetical protein [Bacteroidota bacterium]
MYTGEIVTAVVLFGIVFWNVYRIRKARKIARSFFQKKQIQIITIKYRFFVPLFHFIITSNFQVWFYTQLRNENGDTAEAYVKIGHWFAGLLEPIVQVFQIDDDGKLIDRTRRMSILDALFPERRN